MDVPLVMVQITATNLFSRQSKQLGLFIKGWVLLLIIIILTLSGCQRNPSDTESIWGESKDITETLHHRLQAGIFEIGKDAVICELIPEHSWSLRIPFKPRTGANETARISWERGSFWVQTDDHALIVIYLDEETILSHIQVTPMKGCRTLFQFREFINTPVRDPFRSLFGM